MRLPMKSLRFPQKPMRFPMKPIAVLTLLLAAAPMGATAQEREEQENQASEPAVPEHRVGAGQEVREQEDTPILRVTLPDEGPERIHRLRTRTRHTTIIVLPEGENILDFVVGDSDYWHLTGAANVAFLKPLTQDAETNVALVCESGRIYSFLVAEHGDRPPHLVVRLESGTGQAGLTGGAAHQPAFVGRNRVAAYQRMAADATEAARNAQQEAEARIQEAKSQAASQIEQFRAAYPTRLAFAYRLDRDAADRPFRVEAMWHDGQFTYIRSHGQESAALYELRDGKPALVAYDLTQDGLYIARHVLGDGWLQIGDERLRWRFTRPEGLR